MWRSTRTGEQFIDPDTNPADDFAELTRWISEDLATAQERALIVHERQAACQERGDEPCEDCAGKGDGCNTCAGIGYDEANPRELTPTEHAVYQAHLQWQAQDEHARDKQAEEAQARGELPF